MKGVIPAAGKGERLRPFTLSIPKEMIRVGKKPVIEYVIENLKSCGISDIVVVTGWKKGALLDYLGSGDRLGVNIFYRVQEEQLGTAHAVSLAKEWVGDEDFIVIFGDNYFKPAGCIKKVLRLHKEKKSYATFLVHPVKNATRFGVVSMDSEGKIIKLKEKPDKEEVKDYEVDGKYYSVAGLIVLNPLIFKYIQKTKPGINKEMWLTDAIELMIKDGHPAYASVLKGLRYDIGTFESLRLADLQEYGIDV